MKQKIGMEPMMKLNRSILSLVAIAAITANLFAGDNSQASFADIKEAVYKLIVNGKDNSIKVTSIESRLASLESDYSKRINVASQKDKTDLFIEDFVKKNEKSNK